jgi:hypothetical protein
VKSYVEYRDADCAVKRAGDFKALLEGIPALKPDADGAQSKDLETFTNARKRFHESCKDGRTEPSLVLGLHFSVQSPYGTYDSLHVELERVDSDGNVKLLDSYVKPKAGSPATSTSWDYPLAPPLDSACPTVRYPTQEALVAAVASVYNSDANDCEAANRSKQAEADRQTELNTRESQARDALKRLLPAPQPQPAATGATGATGVTGATGGAGSKR